MRRARERGKAGSLAVRPAAYLEVATRPRQSDSCSVCHSQSRTAAAGRHRQNDKRFNHWCAARSGPDTPCENSPNKARASLELPVSATLLRTLSLVFLSERPIEFWGLWFYSIKKALWKTGKFLAQN